MEAVPEWIKLLPTVMMAIGAYVSYVFYIRRPYVPEELANQHQMLYQFLLNKWYFASSMTDLRSPGEAARTFPVESRRRLHHRRFGPDGVSARYFDFTRNVVRLQTAISITTRLRC